MLNVQIILNHSAKIDCPDFAKLVQLRAREGEGAPTYAIRANLDSDEKAEAMEQWLDAHPADIARIQRTVRIAEYGGGLSKTGRAQIVCGVEGEKLKPIARHSSFGADHAVFFVHEALVVNYHRRHGEG